MIVKQTEGVHPVELAGDEHVAVANTGADVDPVAFSLREQLLKPQTLLSFAVAMVIVIFAVRGLRIDIVATLSYMRQADPWMLLAGLGMFYLTFPVRALRWRLMLANTGVPLERGRGGWASFPALLEYLYLGWFANCIVPAKLGDAYRGYLVKKNGGIAFSTVFGTIFAERLLDILGLFGSLVLAAWFTFGAQIPEGTQVVFGFGALLAAVVIAGLVGMRYLGTPFRALIPKRLREVYGRFEHAALNSFSLAILPRLLLFTVLVWLLEGLRLFFVIKALTGDSAPISLAATVFVALTSSLLTAVPFTPAGLGLVESVSSIVLTFLGVNKNLGIAMTVLDRVINYWSIVVGGFLVYLFSKRK